MGRLTVDLFGEQTLQGLTAMLQAASMLLAAIAVVLWSVRTFSFGRRARVRADVPVLSRLASMERMNRPSDQALRSSIPARAPPGSFLRPSPDQSAGIRPRD
jgi:hypothetical protein